MTMEVIAGLTALKTDVRFDWAFGILGIENDVQFQTRTYRSGHKQLALTDNSTLVADDIATCAHRDLGLALPNVPATI